MEPTKSEAAVYKFMSEFSVPTKSEKSPTDEQMGIVFAAVIKAGLERKDPDLNLKNIFIQKKSV